jgi:alkylation response protein AidB-like acyl-CoA dehydrogenase
MRYAPSAEQQQFAAALHDLLAGPRGTTRAASTRDSSTRDTGTRDTGNGGPSDIGPAGAVRAAREWAAGDHGPGLALWRRLAEMGVTALAVPQRWGGLGAAPADIVVACEELGHHALAGPVAESVAAVPQLLVALGDEQLCARWLPGLAAGDLIATMAMPPRLPYAADADAAGLVLLVDEDRVRLAAPVARHRSVDPARWLFEVRGEQVLGGGPAVREAAARALELGTLACAAQLIGAGHALLEASVRHAGQRVQFGRPVGAFQAVKHQLADVAIGLEFARPLAYAAAISLADGEATAARDISAAKVACADAAYRAARVALQVHGAIGYTREHDLGLWLMKVRALVSAWGSQSEHRALVMQALTADGGAPWS